MGREGTTLASRPDSRRIAGHCIYCGASTDNPKANTAKRRLACAEHRPLLEHDPHHCPDIRQPLEQPPDLPVLIFTRKAA